MNTKRGRVRFTSPRDNQQRLKGEENNSLLHNTKALSFSNGDFLGGEEVTEMRSFIL